MSIRIWFNHWFSTAYNIIKLIKDASNGEYEIFVTNRNAYSATFEVSDYHEIEPSLCDEKYIDYCLNFCKTNRISLFVPRTGLLAISQARNQFESIGVRLLICQDSDVITNLAHKEKFYQECSRLDIGVLPEYYVADNAQDFLKYYEVLSSRGHTVCFKPVRSEGGIGFCIIDKSSDPFDLLMGPLTYRVTLDNCIRAISSKKSFKPLMLMEYLPGYEYSIDCIGYKGKLIAAVPRKKLDGRVRFLEDNIQLQNLATQLTDAFGLSYCYNIQVRYNKDIPKLIEINPRMSGGLYMSALSGVNFPYIAVKLAMEEECNVPTPKFGITATQIESELVLSQNK